MLQLLTDPASLNITDEEMQQIDNRISIMSSKQRKIILSLVVYKYCFKNVGIVVLTEVLNLVLVFEYESFLQIYLWG
jgi:hypothetical protein